MRPRCERQPGVPDTAVRMVACMVRLMEAGEVTRAWMRRQWPEISRPMQQRDIATLRHTLRDVLLLPAVDIHGGVRLLSHPAQDPRALRRPSDPQQSDVPQRVAR